MSEPKTEQIERNEQMAQRRREGASFDMIAKEHGITRQRVSQILRQMGVETDDMKRAARDKQTSAINERNTSIADGFRKGASLEQLAANYGLSPSTVRKIINDAGIDLNPDHSNRDARIEERYRQRDTILTIANDVNLSPQRVRNILTQRIPPEERAVIAKDINSKHTRGTRNPERDARAKELRDQGWTLFAIGKEFGISEMSAWHAVERARGREPKQTAEAKRKIGQMTDSARNKAVELRAMDEAARCYREKGWKVEDVSATESYDLRCTRDGDELHVEVKGVTSDGSEVNLTRNEVEHARERRTALFVLSHIEVSYADDGPEASGGNARVLCPWRVDDGDLTALAYSYRVPGDG